MDNATKLLLKSEFEKTSLDSAVLMAKGELLNEAAAELAALRADNARLREELLETAVFAHSICKLHGRQNHTGNFETCEAVVCMQTRRVLEETSYEQE